MTKDFTGLVDGPTLLYHDLRRRYDAGAKTLVMDRQEAEIVLGLLRKELKSQ